MVEKILERQKRNFTVFEILTEKKQRKVLFVWVLF